MGAAQCSGCASNARRDAVPREDREDRPAAGTLLEVHSSAEEPTWHKSQSSPALVNMHSGRAVSSTARPRLNLPPEDALAEADCSISEVQLLSQTSTAASADGGGVATSAADADSMAEDMKYLSGSSGKSSATRRMKQPRQRPQSAAARVTSASGGPLGGGGPAAGGVAGGPKVDKAAAEKSCSTKSQTKEASVEEATAPRSSPPTGQKRRTSTAKGLSKKAEEAPLKNSGAEQAQALGAGNCPSSRRQEHLEKELRQVQRRMQQGSQKGRGSDQPSIFLDSELSAGEREAKRFMFISFYREMYQRLKAKGQAQQSNLDPSAYAGQDSAGLSIQGGHRHMPRPTDVDLPAEHGKQLGTISAAELMKFDCHSKRMLVSIHGDIFDVSDRPDKYSAEGPYWSMTGHDITWGLFLGNDTEECYDKYYDIFKTPPQALDRKLQGICSWWAFYESEYGAPVGRLDVYDKEWTLPAPPWEGEEACCVM